MKAYRLYDIHAKQVFVSRNVIFHEEVFPFQFVIDTTHLSDPFPDLVLPIPLSDSSLTPTSHQFMSSRSSPDHLPSSSQFTSLPPLIPICRSSRTIKPHSYLIQAYHLVFSKHNSFPITSHLHPLSQVLSYNSLSPSYRHFVLQISSTFEP